jgi:AcrR family transcriptional regulator
LSIARIRATGVTDLCRPDRKIVAEASLRDRRIRILDAAARPFVGQGFAATSLDRVSDKIGSAGGAIHCHYRSKPGPFLAVHRRAMKLAQLAISPPRPELAEVDMLRDANEALCIRIIKEGITSGEPRPVNLRLVAKSLLGVLNRTLRWYHTHEGESGAARMAESIGELVGRAGLK